MSLEPAIAAGIRWSKRSNWIVALIAFVGLLYWASALNGHHRVLSTSCSGGGTIDLHFSRYDHPLDFERGGSYGYDLVYRTNGGRAVSLYNDNFSLTDTHSGLAAPYVNWAVVRGQALPTPQPSYSYAPLPRNGPVHVIKTGAQLGGLTADDQIHFPGPDYMNIFVDPTKMTVPEFASMAECLSKNEAAIDDQLASLRHRAPSSTYQPLRIGGAYYGPPPYDDPNYASDVASLLSAPRIPNSGRFYLYPGHVADGEIDGRHVEVALTPVGDVDFHIDGSPVTFDKTGKGSQPGISSWAGGRSYIFGAVSCPTKVGQCHREITPFGARDHGAYLFWVSVQRDG